MLVLLPYDRHFTGEAFNQRVSANCQVVGQDRIPARCPEVLFWEVGVNRFVTIDLRLIPSHGLFGSYQYGNANFDQNKRKRMRDCKPLRPAKNNYRSVRKSGVALKPEDRKQILNKATWCARVGFHAKAR
jgi:hypothetical protein